jgi:mutator protein MutT
MAKERFKLVVAVYIVLEKEGRVLLSRRFQTGYEDGNYSLPAGHIDGNETLREAIKREAKEEIGIEIESKKLEHILTMHRFSLDDERMDIFFTIKDWVGEIRNMELNKCDDLQWFLLDSLPSNTIPYIKTALEYYKQGVKYCEYGR